MSQSLSVATVIEKNRLSSDTPFLVCLDVEVVDPATGMTVEHIYLVNNTENIAFNGNTYVAASFDIELKSEIAMQQNVKLSIKDFSKAIQARMQAYGGGVGFAVTISVVNSGNLTQPPEIVEHFEVITAGAADYVASFTLGAESALSKTFPRRKQTRDYCQWRYKEGGTCGYTGALPTCDLSLQGPNGCAAHGNTLRFGGYPGINSKSAVYG